MDCRFSCLIFPFYANKFPISSFEKTAAYSTICSRIVSVKPVFLEKCADFSAKNVPISSHFCGFPQTFRRLSTAFSTICGKIEIARNFGNFSGCRKSFPTSFHENPIFCFNSFNMRIFEKFCHSIFLEFSTKFSTSFSFQLHNLSTFQNE